jgi:hypothetical protein
MLYWVINPLIVIGAFLPPTIAFFKMTNHHYDATHREKLHKTYMISAVYVGVPLMLWHLYIPLATYGWCGECYVYLPIWRTYWIETTTTGLLIFDIVSIGIMLGFRLWFGHTMKKFAAEARTASMIAQGISPVQFAPMTAMHAQPMMQPGM